MLAAIMGRVNELAPHSGPDCLACDRCALPALVPREGHDADARGRKCTVAFMPSLILKLLFAFQDGYLTAKAMPVTQHID